jgi:hypothetical protein
MDKLRYLIGNALPLVEFFWGRRHTVEGHRCVTHFKSKPLWHFLEASLARKAAKKASEVSEDAKEKMFCQLI